jgi:hypothetical protein
LGEWLEKGLVVIEKQSEKQPVSMMAATSVWITGTETLLPSSFIQRLRFSGSLKFIGNPWTWQDSSLDIFR